MKRPGYQTIDESEFGGDGEVGFGGQLEEPRRRRFNFSTCDISELSTKDVLLFVMAGSAFILSLCRSATTIQKSVFDHNLKLELDSIADKAFLELNSMVKQTDDELDCEGTVVIIRHCEKHINGAKKSRDFKHCNFLGFERSYYIATLFGDESEAYPKPAFIYSMGTNKRHHDVKREVETVLPLAQKSNIEVRDDFYEGDEKKLSKEIIQLLKDGELCGKVAVISWEHGDIPVLANALGCRYSMGCPMEYSQIDFDSMWQIKFVYSKPLLGGVGGHAGKSHEWEIYGTTTREHFDPLHFSKVAGDYPIEGTNKIGRWATNGFETSLRRKLQTK